MTKIIIRLPLKNAFVWLVGTLKFVVCFIPVINNMDPKRMDDIPPIDDNYTDGQSTDESNLPSNVRYIPVMRSPEKTSEQSTKQEQGNDNDVKSESGSKHSALVIFLSNFIFHPP